MSNNLYLRYVPQINYNKVGYKGQQKISNSSALIVGCGAVGSVIANSLARMGIGYIRLIDDDTVELDNLQRQILYTENDVKNKAYKVQACKSALEQINSIIKIESVVGRITQENINQYAEGIDIIFDGTDNLETRYIINSFAIESSISYIYGAAAGNTGSVMLIHPEGPCFNCLLHGKQHGETAQTAGILNQLTMIVGSIESMIGLRIIINDYSSCIGKLYMIDAWDFSINTFEIKKNPECAICGKRLSR